MNKIAEFTVQVFEEEKRFKFQLSAEGDDFVTELEEGQDVIEEVDELLLEKLKAYGIPFPKEY